MMLATWSKLYKKNCTCKLYKKYIVMMYFVLVHYLHTKNNYTHVEWVEDAD